MRALDRKLVRDLRRIWAQSLAIALVLACGIMVLVLSQGAQRSLAETRDAYYDRHRFADVFASLTRAPVTLLPDIAAIDGVGLAEGRIVLPATVDLEGMAEAATARVLSLPDSGAPVLNQPLLRAGRMPDPLRRGEVAVSEPFAQANGLLPGSRFHIVLNGQRRELTVTGHVLSPEFIYTMAPGAMMPDDRRFALIWMAESDMAAAGNLTGAFNDLTLTLARGADERAVIAALDRMLAPYGGTGAIGRDRQASNAFLANELEQLRAMAVILPPIFLVVSAFLVNMVLGRLIALDRHQIGLLKAVGYDTGTIAWHYLKMSAGIGVLGVLLGWVAGWWLGQAMTRMYAGFFRFPWLIYVPGLRSFAISGALGIATVVLGALRAVRASVRLPPAVAMSPPAPPVYAKGIADIAGHVLRLRQTSMMILRSITRWPGRAAVTLFGVSASVAVLVSSFFIYDMVGRIMDEIFNQANRQDVTLVLSANLPERALDDARALPGVRTAEGGFALPVRLSNEAESRLVVLQAHSPESRLTRILDAQGRSVALPSDGLVLPQSLADGLGLAQGDRAVVELLAPPRETWVLPVTAVVHQSMGQEIHVAAPALFARLRTAPQVNLLHLLVASDALPALHAQVKNTPAIAGLTLWTEVERQFNDTVAENFFINMAIYTTLGMLITIGVVYNAARIQLAERAHELASLRVLGFTRSEVAYVLVGEIMLLTLAALPVGWLAGYGFARLIVEGFSSDIVSLTLMISRRTYALAALIVTATALGSALVVRRRLDRIDLVSALKQRE